MSLREDMEVLRAFRRAGLEDHYWRGTACLWPQGRATAPLFTAEATPDVTRMSHYEELRVRGE